MSGLPSQSRCISPEGISTATAAMAVSIQVHNRGSEARDVSVRLRILDADGNLTSTTHATQNVRPNETAEVHLTPVVTHPRLWSPINPHLYGADVEIMADNRPLDQV